MHLHFEVWNHEEHVQGFQVGRGVFSIASQYAHFIHGTLGMSGSAKNEYRTILERMGSTRHAIRLVSMVDATLHCYYLVLCLAHRSNK